MVEIAAPNIVSKEESRLRLSADGQWFYEDDAFSNAKIIDFFHQSIRKDDAGRFFLYSRYKGEEEWVYFEAEDTAYFVWDISLDEEQGSFVLFLNTGAEEVLDASTLQEDSQGVLRCRLSRGDRARFTIPSLRRLAEFVEEEGDRIFLKSQGKRIVISGR